MAGTTFSDRWVAKGRRGRDLSYPLERRRLLLLVGLAPLVAFGIAFAAGSATSNSAAAHVRAAAVKPAPSSAVKILAVAPAAAIPAVGKAPVHRVARSTPAPAASPTRAPVIPVVRPVTPTASTTPSLPTVPTATT